MSVEGSASFQFSFRSKPRGCTRSGPTTRKASRPIGTGASRPSERTASGSNSPKRTSQRFDDGSSCSREEPFEFRFRQSAVGRFLLHFRYGLAQASLGLTADAVLLVQPVELSRRQHDGRRRAVFE